MRRLDHGQHPTPDTSIDQLPDHEIQTKIEITGLDQAALREKIIRAARKRFRLHGNHGYNTIVAILHSADAHRHLADRSRDDK
jgi:hypothetical protein